MRRPRHSAHALCSTRQQTTPRVCRTLTLPLRWRTRRLTSRPKRVASSGGDTRMVTWIPRTVFAGLRDAQHRLRSADSPASPLRDTRPRLRGTQLGTRNCLRCRSRPNPMRTRGRFWDGITPTPLAARTAAAAPSIWWTRRRLDLRPEHRVQPQDPRLAAAPVLHRAKRGSVPT